MAVERCVVGRVVAGQQVRRSVRFAEFRTAGAIAAYFPAKLVSHGDFAGVFPRFAWAGAIVGAGRGIRRGLYGFRLSEIGRRTPRDPKLALT